MSTERALLRDASQRFIEASWPLQQVRQLAERESVDRSEVEAYLRKAAELGWFANFVAEPYGGGSVSGHPVLDAVTIGTRRGAFLQPGPWISSNIAADILNRFGTAEQRQRLLPALASAELGVAWLCDPVFGPWQGDTAEQIVARRSRDGFRLTGRSLAVEATTCDLFLASAMLDGRPANFFVPRRDPGVDIQALAAMDLSRRFVLVSLRDVELGAEAVVGDGTTGPSEIERAVTLAAVLASSQTVGAMASMFAMTVDYAKSRVAFGRPIGAFQAVKHQLADLSLRLEGCRAALTAAAGDLDSGDAWAGETASILKAFVSESALMIGQGCLQIHGGIGFTWEHDLHLYYRRLAADAALWGDADWHRERICALQGI